MLFTGRVRQALIAAGLLLAVQVVVPPFGPGQVLAQQDALALITRALQLTKEGKLDEAVALQKRVIPLIEQAAGPRHPLYFMQIALLGDLHVMKQDYAEGERLHLQALKLREQTLGPEHAEVAASLGQLADLYITTANYPKAEATLQRAIRIRARTVAESDPAFGTTYISMGRLAMLRSRFADAEQHFRKGLTLFEKHQKPDHPYIPLLRNNLAEAVRALGRSAEAERLLRDALAANERINGRDSYLLAANLNNLSELFREQGRYGEAEQYSRRSVTLVEKTLGPDHPTIAVNLNNLSLFLMERGRAEEAVSLMRRTLEIERKTQGAEHPSVATALHNLGEALARAGKPADAEALYRQALAMRERVNGPDHLSVGHSAHSIATFLHGQNRFAEAELFARRAVEIRSRNLHPEHPQVASSLANLAVILDEQDKFQEAKSLHERGLALMEKGLGRDHPAYALGLANLAATLAASKDWQAGYDTYRQANGIWTQRRAALLASAGSDNDADIELRQNTVSFLGQVRTGYELWQKAAEAEKAAYLEDGFAAHQWALLSSAASALNKMSARIAAGSGPLAGLVREQQDLTAQLTALDKSLVAAMSADPGARTPEGEADLRKRADAIRARLATIAAELSSRFPDFAAIASPEPASLAQVRQALRPNEAFYTIAMTRHGSFAWLVTSAGERWVRIGRTADKINEDVAVLRCGLDVAGWEKGGPCPRLSRQDFNPAEIQAGRLPPFDVGRAHDLYRALFGQVEDLIRGKELIVVPTGALTQLPFQALVAGNAVPRQDGADVYRRAEWLGRRTAIAVLPAVSSLVALRRHAGTSAAAMPYLGLGNPLLDGPDARYAEMAKRAKAAQACTVEPRPAPMQVAMLPERAGNVLTTAGLADVAVLRSQSPLPETADELCAVAGVLNAGREAVKLGSAATEADLKRMNDRGELTGYRVLHFATHGVLAGEAVGISEPGLLFSPPANATELDDGYLSAAEISGLSLDADLVILSACNTAAGGAGDTDALAGLARSFFYAGARALLVSHWAVNSQATVGLITTALAAMARTPGMSYAQALREAMVSLIDSPEPYASHPAYWAPFVVAGVERADRR